MCLYIYKYMKIMFIFFVCFIFSILHKAIVFPSPGAHTSAAHHRLTCRYWIRVRIMFKKIIQYSSVYESYYDTRVSFKVCKSMHIIKYFLIWCNITKSELGSNIYTSNGGEQPKYELLGMEIRWFYEELKKMKNRYFYIFLYIPIYSYIFLYFPGER